jgi:hypothetical protein
VQLALAINGVNPLKKKRSTWLTWLVVLLNYNMPPWLTTQKHFIMLSLIILGLESIIGDNINVYLKPLVEELKELWEIGVHVQDVATFNGEAKLNM